MQTTWTPTIDLVSLERLYRLRTQGLRAVIEFTPKPTSDERLCAGVVVKTTTGEVHYTCAVDERHMQHAFGDVGAALYDVAHTLCESLADFWTMNQDARRWKPPFHEARLASLEPFSARNAIDACERMLESTSTLYTLGQAYVHATKSRPAGIVERVQSAIRHDANAKHLAKRFHRHLTLDGDAQPLKVDFLGQRYACYFLQVTRSTRGLERTTESAFGKLFELDAVRRLVQQPRQSLGLLQDERPQVFELLMVGNRNDPVQRRAIYQVEALADRSEVVARIEPSATSAAERVAHQERLAA